jgi:hypothetical protein
MKNTENLRPISIVSINLGNKIGPYQGIVMAKKTSILRVSQFAANPSRGRMSPPTVRDVPLPPPLLPALAPQQRDGASMGATGRSTTARPTRHLPTSPHRVEGSRLAGVTSSPVTHPVSATRNVAPTWAATRAGSDISSPAIFDFMSLYVMRLLWPWRTYLC